jgi:hypothetical protein
VVLAVPWAAQNLYARIWREREADARPIFNGHGYASRNASRIAKPDLKLAAAAVQLDAERQRVMGERNGASVWRGGAGSAIARGPDNNRGSK